jgi:hypothetical protein
MRRAVLLGVAFLLLFTRGGFAIEQTVEEIIPPGEQQIQEIGPHDEQAVGGFAEAGEQRVEPQEPPSAAAQMASNVGKAATAVGAATVSLAAMAAMLMFL